VEGGGAGSKAEGWKRGGEEQNVSVEALYIGSRDDVSGLRTQNHGQATKLQIVSAKLRAKWMDGRKSMRRIDDHAQRRQ
jgi:hypothetical protein